MYVYVGGDTTQTLHSSLCAPGHPLPGTPPLLTVSTAHDSTATCSSASPTVVAEPVRAENDLVNNLRKLEIEYTRMMLSVKRLLVKHDLSDTQLSLLSLTAEEFTNCDSINKILSQLERDHMDVFNVSILQDLANSLNNTELIETIEAYDKKKEYFLKEETVLQFQEMVVNRVKPALTSGMATLTIKISREMSRRRTLKNIEEIAMKGFEENHKRFIHLHAEPGSVIISWSFPKKLSAELEQLARTNAIVFQDNKILEVTMGGKIVFQNHQKEVRIFNIKSYSIRCTIIKIYSHHSVWYRISLHQHLEVRTYMHF